MCLAPLINAMENKDDHTKIPSLCLWNHRVSAAHVGLSVGLNSSHTHQTSRNFMSCLLGAQTCYFKCRHSNRDQEPSQDWWKADHSCTGFLSLFFFISLNISSIVKLKQVLEIHLSLTETYVFLENEASIFYVFLDATCEWPPIDGFIISGSGR